MTASHARVNAALSKLGWSGQRWAREIDVDPALVRRWRNPRHGERYPVPDDRLEELERWARDGGPPRFVEHLDGDRDNNTIDNLVIVDARGRQV